MAVNGYIRTLLPALTVLALLAASAAAVSTRRFSLDSAGVLSAGKLEGTAVHSGGSVAPSVETRRIGLDDVGVARSLLTRPDGTAYVGTGKQGQIYKVSGDTATRFAETGELLVTSLVAGPQGTLYAGTLPEGKIFAVDAAGQVEVFAEPDGVDHVWALVYDERRKRLFAATGPEGKVLAIDASGKSDVYYDGDAAHVMSLVQDEDGALYAGTSDEALLLRLTGPGRAEVLYDFEGNEVTALAVRKGVLAVAANLFPKAPKRSKKKKQGGQDKKGTSDKTKPSAAARSKPGKGHLWQVEPSGLARKLFSSAKGHLTALQWADDETIYAAAGKEGHIHRVRIDGTHAVWIDVDERQVLDLDLSGPRPMFVTGDSGAVYRIAAGEVTKAQWTSKVLDAEFRSRWGQLTWRGRGKLAFQTRAGNTDKPDDSWSDWSAPLTGPGPIRSPAARFLQLRARLDVGSDPEMYAVTAYYLPQNQPTSVQEVSAQPKHDKRKKRKEDRRRSGPQPTSTYQLSWKVDNPDGDDLRFRLYYGTDARDRWLPILRDTEVLTEAKHEWETQGVPDGFYRVRVEASDELDNPDHGKHVATGESEPFLVDNHPPRIERLRHSGDTITGVAVDAMGPIAALDYAIDGDDWKPMYPADDLFDTRREPFELKLPSLAAGPHVVAIRARDFRNNPAVAELEIRVR